ncbi:lantibiotic dehydratase [Kitasatospora aureofaciens]|uniref:lantibiotic dehydratase n=1 Tax=Kitasatospora aureofaciens TaxID=1894 RepID=UPI0037F30A75
MPRAATTQPAGPDVPTAGAARTGAAPWVLVRANLVTAPPRPRLHHPELETIHRLRTGRHRDARALLAALYPLGSREQQPELRRAAVALARRVQRDLDAVAVAPAVPQAPSDALPEAVREAAERWRAALADEHDALARLSGLLAEQLAGERAWLSETLADPALQLAATMSSASLAATARRYASAAGRPDKQLRKREPRLLRTAARALHRTSPFSHYTAVGLAWDDRRSGDIRVSDGPFDLDPGTGLGIRLTTDLAALHRLVRARLAALGAAEPLTAAHVTADDGETLRLQQPVDDAGGQSRIVDGRSRTVTLRASAAVRAVLDVLAAGPRPRAELAGLLAAGDPERAPRAAALVDSLVTAGALRTWDPVDPDDTDPVRAAAARLRALDLPGAAALADDLDAIAAATDALHPRHGSGDRAAAVEALTDAWSAAGATPARPAYEDVSAARPVAFPSAAWADVQADLADLTAVADIFDNTHIGHAILHRSLAAEVGVGGTIPFAELARRLPEFLAGQTLDRDRLVAEVCADYPAVATLVELRAKAAAELAAAGRAGRREVVWTPARLRRWAEAVPPELRRDRQALAYFVQPTGQHTRPDGTPRIDGAVLNAVHDGYAQMTSRFLSGWDGEVVTAIRARLAELLGPEAVELRPVHGFNANVHPPLLERSFGTTDRPHPDVPGEAVLDPLSLRVRVGAGTLSAEDADGRPVHPAYFGFLVPFLLPARDAALYMLGRGPLVRMDLGADVERESDPAEIVHHPRVTAGRVVVTRRAWTMPVEAFPVRRPGDDDTTALLAMEAFRRRHDIPARVFVRAEPQAEGAWQQFVAMRTKPVPVDLRSMLDLRSLPAWTAGAARIRVTEALPDTEDRPTDLLAGDRCTEYVLETVVAAGPVPREES